LQPGVRPRSQNENNRAVIAKAVMGKTAKELANQEKLVLDQFLGAPTFYVQSSSPAVRNSPLVIHHSGIGPSIAAFGAFADEIVAGACRYARERPYTGRRISVRSW
jgi:hypothetical protein